jgi:hypothetical protein
MASNPNKVKSCDPKNEQVVSYYEHAATVCEREFGRRPSRTTLFKYLLNGFPVRRGGPYVTIPTFDQLKRKMTTVEAFERFIAIVRRLEAKKAA